jgi:hypothetical protein
MIKILGHAYRKPFADSENEEELEGGLENCQENSQINSKALQQHMASQAQITATRSKNTDKGD